MFDDHLLLAAIDAFDPQPDPYADDPVGFIERELVTETWSLQRAIALSVRDNPRTSVRACHGPGKTAIAARVAAWFLATHENSRVITTAPTWAQVEQLLWREIRGAIGRAHAADVATALPAPYNTKLEVGPEWFAIGLSTDKPERFQGHHAPHILIVVDEASGVDEAIFEVIEGFMTAEGARLLLLGNPTQLGGTFYRSYTAERALWNCIHISVFDTPNYTGENVSPELARALPRADWAAEMAQRYGEQSALYQVRVLGNPPAQADNAVVPLHLVENAQHRDYLVDERTDRVVIACDVARYGDDETVICAKIGKRIRILEHYLGRRPTGTATGPVEGDIVATAGRIAGHARQFDEERVRIVVDDTGVGGGVTDILRNEGWTVTAFNASETAIEEDYPNRRSELWFTMADEISHLDLDDDDQLAADLVAPTYSFDKHGRRVVESKDITKKRLGRSPDRADSVLLTLARPFQIFVPEGQPIRTITSDIGLTEVRSPDGSLTGDLRDLEM